MATTVWRHHAALHRPRFYRCQVADPGLRLIRNRYPSSPAGSRQTRGSAWIGLALVIGRHAYCVTWAHARLRREES